MVNELSGALSSALDVKRARAEIENMHATNANLKSQNKKLDAETELTKIMQRSQMYQSDVNAANAKLLENKIPSSEIEKTIDESKAGVFQHYLKRIVDSIPKFRFFK